VSEYIMIMRRKGYLNVIDMDFTVASEK
jgi:hypothetical protein